MASLSYTTVGAQGIEGRIGIDTSLWAPVAYLSIIPDFTQMNTMSYENIIERVDIDDEGRYSFNPDIIPDGDHLYRVHFARKEDPPASLIIGGSEENHFFLIARKGAGIDIQSDRGVNLINNLSINGYAPNMSLTEVCRIADYLDTLDYYGTNLNRDFIKVAVKEKLLDYADTCNNPLVSLYALYQVDFEKDYLQNRDFYDDYLKKWKKEDSEYFRVFRSKFPEESKGGGLISLIAIVVIVVLPFLIYYYRKKNKKEESPITLLSIQERRVFSMIQQGFSNKEISDELGISLSTVKTHVNNIYSKLKISSRKEAIDFR
jgi:DNA-binding CsgD family transcriptional regulator